jgi:hypothetical protein
LTSIPEQQEYPEELDDARWPKERKKETLTFLKLDFESNR